MSRPATARDQTIEVLRKRNIEYVFGNPGTTELDLISGLPKDIEYILCLQESIAVGAAAGYALTGNRPAVVSLHTLAGVGHAMGALHGARLMHAPVVALVGQQHSHHLHREPLLYGDIVSTARPATRWVNQPVRAEDVAPAIERAFRIALSPPMGPTMVVVPMDFWDQHAGPAAVAITQSPPKVSLAFVESVRSKLKDSQKGVLITGDRMNGDDSWDAAVRIAEAYDLDVYAAPIGFQPGFPTDHPRFRGTLPLTAGGISSTLDGVDVAVVVGAPIFTLYLHDGQPMLPSRTEFIMISDDAAEIGRAPVEHVQMGDPSAFLVDLAEGVDLSPEPRIVRAPDVGEGVLALNSAMAVVASQAPDTTVFIDESMTAGGVVRSSVVVRRPRHYLRTSTGVLGTGLPAAVGAAIANPGAPVIALVGDGALLFAPQALWTARRRNLRLIVVVLNNGGYESLRGYEAAELQHLDPTPGEFDIGGIDIPGLALSLGVRGVGVDSVSEMARALGDALDHDGPTVIDARLDR